MASEHATVAKGIRSATRNLHTTLRARCLHNFFASLKLDNSGLSHCTPAIDACTQAMPSLIQGAHTAPPFFILLGSGSGDGNRLNSVINPIAPVIDQEQLKLLGSELISLINSEFYA